MRTLPDNPNLDHLRRQAKDLLTGLRDGNPAASLSDAQSSLAEQYGFRGWAELKAEVDRRQGHADVAAPELAGAVAARFGLGQVTGPMRSMARADEVGRRWLLETARGKWSARTVDDVFPVTDGEDNARFQEAAIGAGVTAPAPVRTSDGTVTAAIEGHSWRVHELLPSGPPLAAPVNATITRAVGAILATLHGLKVPPPGLCPWSSIRFAELSWPGFADLAAAKGASWAPILAAAVPTLQGLQEVGAEKPETADVVLCHNNLSPGNVRVGAGGRLVVTGWEHAAGLLPAWELSSALVSWVVDPNGGINAAAVRSMVDGYRERAGGVPELSLATFRGTATALQNYVSGQIHTALETGADEDVRSVRHLLTHLPSRETFEQVIDAITR